MCSKRSKNANLTCIFPARAIQLSGLTDRPRGSDLSAFIHRSTGGTRRVSPEHHLQPATLTYRARCLWVDRCLRPYGSSTMGRSTQVIGADCFRHNAAGCSCSAATVGRAPYGRGVNTIHCPVPRGPRGPPNPQFLFDVRHRPTSVSADGGRQHFALRRKLDQFDEQE